MRLCFICNEYPPARQGGIGSVTRTLARALVEAGHQVRVIGLSDANESAPCLECDAGVLVWRLKHPSSHLSWIRSRYLLYRTVKDWVRSGLIDLVEAPDYEGMVAGWPVLPIPVIARMHGSVSYFALEMAKRPKTITFFLERASLWRANFYCSCSRYTADRTRRLFRLHGSEITVLHNPVTTTASISVPPRAEAKVVFGGTLTPKKGITSLVRGWPLVVRACPNAELHIFGKDGRTDSGEKMKDFLISSLPAETRNTVYFHGHVEHAALRSAFRTASVAVFPSYSEAFALAPMEAMSEACPTIYSRRASATELIENGKNGLLVDPDDHQEIADAIVSVLRNCNLAAALGVAGRACIEKRFSLSALLQKNIDFYVKCLRSYRASFRERTPARSRAIAGS